MITQTSLTVLNCLDQGIVENDTVYIIFLKSYNYATSKLAVKVGGYIVRGSIRNILYVRAILDLNTLEEALLCMFL